MFPLAANARPLDPLLEKAIMARIENKPEHYVYKKVPGEVLRQGNTATVQRLADGEVESLNPDQLEAWLGGDVEGIDGVKLDPFVVSCDAYLRKVSVTGLTQNRAINADILTASSYKLVQLMEAKRERLLGSLLTTTANWHANSGAVAAGAKWTASGGDPIKLLHEMADAVGGQDLVMSRSAYNAFVRNSKVLSDQSMVRGSSVLTDQEAVDYCARYGLRLHVSRARFRNGATYSQIMAGDFVWLGDISERPIQVNAGGSTFRVTSASVLRLVEQIMPPPDSNRGRAGYVLGGVRDGLYFHQFANNAAEATQINLGYSEGLAVGVKGSGLVKTGLV